MKTENISPVKQEIGGIFVIVNNMPRAVQWYREILGLPKDEEYMKNSDPEERGIYSIPLGEANLILDSMHRDELKPSENHLFLFNTDDIEATFEFVKSKNVEILSPIEGVEHPRFFTVKDSEGNVVMFCQ